MLRAYKYRLSPNVKQEIALAKTFGCVRYFWNKQVENFNSYNKETNPKPKYKTSTEFRRETKWMLEVSAAAILSTSQNGTVSDSSKQVVLSLPARLAAIVER